MASSDDIKNSLDNIADKIEDLSDDLQNTYTVLNQISSHLIVSNISHARNARANDILWKLNANTQQLNTIKNSNESIQSQQNAVETLTS